MLSGPEQLGCMFARFIRSYKALDMGPQQLPKESFCKVQTSCGVLRYRSGAGPLRNSKKRFWCKLFGNCATHVRMHVARICMYIPIPIYTCRYIYIDVDTYIFIYLYLYIHNEREI